jgi:uncharacterized protein (TIGR01777 family)
MSDITTATNAKRLRILIPGGRGHIGQLLARHFVAQGHIVAILTRRPVHTTLSVHSTQISWDGRTLGPWAAALEDVDVLINLAGRSVDCRYNAKNRDQILRSRVDSTTVLGSAIQATRHRPRVWLNASTATIYGHTFDYAMDEHSGEFGGNEADAPSSWRFSVDVARQWEQAFFSSCNPGTRKIALRAAMVMSPEPGGAFFPILRLVRLGLGGAWGSGRQYMSWIHAADFIRAVEFLIDHQEMSGPVNLSAPHPLPNSQFLAVLRNAWSIRIGLPTPAWMLAIGAFFLRTETELLLKSRRVVPAMLLNHGFTFRFPGWPSAARDLVEQSRMDHREISNRQLKTDHLATGDYP